MSVDRVLIEIMTQANMAGVTKAKAGFAGLIGNVAGAAVVIGGLYELTKTVIDITEEHSKAENNLAAAIKSRGGYYTATMNSLNAFMQTNRDFISNQNEVINSYAALTREGVKAKDLSRLMTIALHIQAAEGGTLADAVFKVQQAEVGRNRGLSTAVGLTLEAFKSTDTLAEKHAKVERNLKRVAAAYANVKLTPLQVASNHLSTSWEKLAEDDGPALVEFETSLIKFADESLIPSFRRTSSAVDDIGKSIDALIAHPSWDKLYNVLFGSPGPIIVPGGPLDRLINALQHDLGAGGNRQDQVFDPRTGKGRTPGHGAGAPSDLVTPSAPLLSKASLAAQGAIVLSGPVTVVTSQAHAVALKAAIRRSDKALR